MCMFLSVYMCTACMQEPTEVKRGLGPLELKL